MYVLLSFGFVLRIDPILSHTLSTSSITEQHSHSEDTFIAEVTSERMTVTLRGERWITAKPDGLGLGR